eukprot:TRINITY_DN1180_c0_g1_i1.p1 TRINITY_DN1180_c0_g1~~TRINITY_DN1180_c0_g1_i1.p1  ORF type:complete len:236 (-),score=40.07 TRINITY_DN1180_c0_g1_i1:132-839(-)
MSQQNNPPLNQICDELVNATKVANTTLLEHLLNKHADTLAVDSSWHIAIHEGAKQRNIECLKLLIKHGANINVTDANGASALHKAVGTASISFDSENVEVVQFLIHNGADCSLKDRLGTSPLHLAARYGQIKIVQILMENETPSRMEVINDRRTTEALAACSSPYPTTRTKERKSACGCLKPSWKTPNSTTTSCVGFCSPYNTSSANQPTRYESCNGTIRDLVSAIFCIPCFVKV